MRRVVVTGMGLLTTLGNDKETSWNNLINSKSGIRKIEHFDVSSLPAKIAGFINNNIEDDHYFNKLAILEPRDIKRIDRLAIKFNFKHKKAILIQSHVGEKELILCYHCSMIVDH